VDHDRLESTAANCAKYAVPPPEPVVTIGSARVTPEEAVTPEAKRPEYFVEAWAGTAAMEFAKLCGHNNNIPLKMYIEAFRTVLGAVVGDRIHCNLDGAIPRLYTFLVAPFGKGKGTSAKRVRELFK